MKKLLAAAALLAAGVGVNSAATATATASTMTKGKLVGFTYNGTTKAGKVVISRASGKYTYRVDSHTDCGFSTGQSGDQIRCGTLGKRKYDHKPVRVSWHRAAGGARVADVVAVDLS